MTSPNATRPSVTSTSRRDSNSPLRISRQVLHQAAELLAAALEVVELVIARAGGREEHDLARFGRRRGGAHRRREVAAPLVRHPGSVQRPCQLLGRFADQVGTSHPWTQLARERAEVLALQRAAEEEPERRVE